MDVGVLLQAGTGRESLAALRTSVAPGADVMRSDVALQVRRIGKNLPDVRLLATF